MSNPITFDAPRPIPSKGGTPLPTMRLSRGQTLLARLGPRVLLPVALLLGILIGSAIVLLVQLSHSVVATVNGAPIRQGDFYHRLELAAGPQVLQQMVNEEMQVQFAAKQGVMPTDADVEAKFEKASKQPNFAQNLAKSRQTEDDVRRGILVSLAQYDVMTKGVSVSDADVLKFYNDNVNTSNPNARYYSPEAVQVAIIVTPTQQAQNQAIADMAAGLSFAQAAAKYSIDSSKANGGLLKPLLRGRSAVSKIPQLETLLFQMRPSQQRIGVKVGSAWWIIRCLGYSPAATKPFAAVQDDARMGAMLTKGEEMNGQAVRQAYADFQRTSQIKPIWPQYKPLTSAGQ